MLYFVNIKVFLININKFYTKININKFYTKININKF